jgi:cyclomaltodextrinase
MKDFIFGTLATEELRIEHVRTRRAGVSHYQQRQPRDPLPGQEITVELSVGPDHPVKNAWVYWSNDGDYPAGKDGEASHGFTTLMEKAGVEWDTVLWGYISHFRAVIPGQPTGTVLRYYISIMEGDHHEVLADQGFTYACYIADDPLPAWTGDAIVYQIFVDRFNPGKGKEWLAPSIPAGIYGGTLNGITEKLDYLLDVGVTVLWLTPIFPSPSHHGYDATDLFEVEPRFGTKADLRLLLDEAHVRGIRILLDLAPNHVSNMHSAFQAAIKDQTSPYSRWFTFIHWPDRYKSFFDVPELPQLNLREPAARQYMLEAAVYWLEFGVDGYRVDYALGPVPDFWADFRRVTRQTRPDCWTFGEVVEPPDSQITFSGGLDGCLDFNLMEAFRKAFAYGEWNALQFASYVERHEAYFPGDFSRPCFLDNHDMNRFLWAAGGELNRLRLAALCQFTLIGPPVIYYGTEAGLSQLRDVRQDGRGLPEESRLPMLWGEQQDKRMIEYYRSLVRMRKQLSPLRTGKMKVKLVDEDTLVYSKLGSDKLIVALNLSKANHTLSLRQNIKECVLESVGGAAHWEQDELTLGALAGAVLFVE